MYYAYENIFLFTHYVRSEWTCVRMKFIVIVGNVFRGDSCEMLDELKFIEWNVYDLSWKCLSLL